MYSIVLYVINIKCEKELANLNLKSQISNPPYW